MGMWDLGDFAYLKSCWGGYYDCDPPDYRTGDGCCGANLDSSADGFVGPGDWAGFMACYPVPGGVLRSVRNM